jgi:hypothetical protein
MEAAKTATGLNLEAHSVGSDNEKARFYSRFPFFYKWRLPLGDDFLHVQV